MPPKNQVAQPDPQYATSEEQGLAAAATVCRNSRDPEDREMLLGMLGLGSEKQLRDRLAERAGRPFNHFPSALM